MFEEEAEEYKDNTRIKDKNTYIGFPDERISELQDFEGNYIDISERIIKTFKDAATFGYNKAKEEIAELEAQIEKMQEKLKADLIARLEEQIQYSTSPSCTKGMKLFIKSIEEWEIKEK